MREKRWLFDTYGKLFLVCVMGIASWALLIGVLWFVKWLVT